MTTRETNSIGKTQSVAPEREDQKDTTWKTQTDERPDTPTDIEWTGLRWIDGQNGNTDRDKLEVGKAPTREQSKLPNNDGRAE